MSFDYARTFNIPILRELVGALSLPQEGKKSELAARLREYDQDNDYPAYQLWHYYLVTGEIPLGPTERRRAETFSRLDSPSAEAKFDPKWFMSKYFLNAAGEPDRRTTSTPIELHGLDALQRQRVHAAANRILGLHTGSGGPDRSRVLGIGWDKSAIMPKVNSAGELLYNNSQSTSGEIRGQKLENHRTLSKNRNLHNPKREFKPRYAIGSYLIKCKTISDGYTKSVLKLDIMHGSAGLAGGFDFGVVKGIMRFGPRPRALPYFCENEEASDSDNADECNTADSDEETQNHSLKRKAPSLNTQAPEPKRAKTNPIPPYRLYLQWRGKETGTGKILLDHSDEHKGYIDFTDSTCTRFTGIVHLIDDTGEVKFQGYKVAGEGASTGGRWEDYSEKAYEYESRARWRRR